MYCLSPKQNFLAKQPFSAGEKHRKNYGRTELQFML